MSLRVRLLVRGSDTATSGTEDSYQVFASRPIYGRVTPAELAAAGYPSVPEEAVLETARRELRQAIARDERERIPALHAAVRGREERLVAAKRSLRGSGRLGSEPTHSVHHGRPSAQRVHTGRAHTSPAPVPSPA